MVWWGMTLGDNESKVIDFRWMNMDEVFGNGVRQLRGVLGGSSNMSDLDGSGGVNEFSVEEEKFFDTQVQDLGCVCVSGLDRRDCIVVLCFQNGLTGIGPALQLAAADYYLIASRQLFRWDFNNCRIRSILSPIRSRYR